MSTHYDRLPTIEERVRASRLIVTGHVQSIKLLPPTQIGPFEEEQAIAHVAIEKVLRGEPNACEIDVRFVRLRENRVESHPFTENQYLVLMLVPDVGYDTRPDVYVAYLRGAFPLTADEDFVIETESSEGGSCKTVLTLNALRDVVKMIATEEAIEAKGWTTLEPELVAHATQPVLSLVTELPDSQPGPKAAVPAAPPKTPS